MYRNYGTLPVLAQAPISSLRPVLESCLQLLHIWEARIKQKGDSKCIPWKSLKDLILAHLDTKKRVDVFPLSIYGLVVFPKALGHVDEVVTDLFDRLDKRVTPVQMILAETFRVDRVSYRVFFKNYSPLKEIATPRRDDILEEKWMAILQKLHKEDIE
ncbi:hypothetical protein Goshw_009910 [Gossypium schwendimanii]|uniref:Uncharacterized protein n=1 Tax=Gossypium schwendimanii TaxID=34291 RepID=A0A7J9NCL7_GOSSC|nr:hypothetical protein [Gossypium schwendimanii]